MKHPESKPKTFAETDFQPIQERSGESDLIRDIADATGQSPNDVTSALLGLLPERIVKPAPPSAVSR